MKRRGLPIRPGFGCLPKRGVTWGGDFENARGAFGPVAAASSFVENRLRAEIPSPSRAEKE